MRSRSKRVRAIVTGFVVATACLMPSPAEAEIGTIYHMDIFEPNFVTYTGGPWYTSGPNHAFAYAWTSDNAHSSLVRSTYCSDYGLFTEVRIQAHDTTYADFPQVWESPGTCTVIRARSLYGAQYNRNGTYIL